MKDYKVLLMLGIVGLITPFLGVPEVYKNWIIGVISVILIIYSLRNRKFEKEEKTEEEEVFVESNGINSEVLEQGEKFEEEIMKSEDE